MQFTVGQIAEMVQGQVEGDPNTAITGVGKIETAQQGDLAFLSNPKYESYIYDSEATAILVNESLKPKKAIQSSLIRVPDAYLAFTKLLEAYEQMTSGQQRGVEQGSAIDDSTQIPDSAYVGSFAYIGPNCKIGEDVKIHPHAWIEGHCQIGDHTEIQSGAKIYKNTNIGQHCTIQANAVIGSSGFGFAPKDDGSYEPIPQIGSVKIENRVSIGAGTTIDRATMGETIIHEGVKIDNLVQIAHNVEIGKHTVIAAQAGISGSSKVGAYCLVAGQVGIVGHISIADKTKIGAKAGVSKSITETGTTRLGQPARKFSEESRSMAVYRRLPDLKKSIDEIKRAVKQQNGEKEE